MWLGWLAIVVVGGCSLPEFRGTTGGGGDGGSGSNTVDARHSSSHDEDGDGIPDDQDLCPTINDVTIIDSDNDGVGDPCDPAPMSPGDHGVLFTFEDGDVSGLDVTGTVVADTDQIQVGDPLTSDAISLFVHDTQYTRAHVELGYKIIEAGIGELTDDNYEELEIFTSHTGSSQLDGVGCSLQRQYQGSVTRFYIEDPIMVLMEVSEPYQLVGSQGKLAVDQHPTLGCTSTLDGQAPQLITGSTSNVRGGIGFYAKQLRAEIHYLYVAGQ
jgi:hypothetical protein